MQDSILRQAYEEITEDNKLILLATITSFFHSIIFVAYLLYQSYSVMTKANINETFGLLSKYAQQLFAGWNGFIRVAIFIVIFFIGYFLLPPITEWSIVHYISSEKKSWTISLVHGFKKFFTMFEYSGIVSIFSYFIIILALWRLYVLEILGNPVVLFLLGIWFAVIFGVGLFLPYVRFLIILEWYWLSDAIKTSMGLAFDNFRLTLRYVLISYLLYLRVLLNIVIVIWIPFVLLYIAMHLDLKMTENLKNFFYVLFFLLICLTAYVNGIVDAFFVSYWYKVYNQLPWERSPPPAPAPKSHDNHGHDDHWHGHDEHHH